MAVRNGEVHLREAIESVLAQSVGDFEFVIVDDASTDNTPSILAEYQSQDSRLSVLHNESRLGPYPSANRALMHARGNVVARHDADDISPPDRFAIQLEALDSDQGISLVTGAVEVFCGNTGRVNMTIRPPSWQPRLEWELLFGNVVGGGAHVMFPRVVRGTPVLFPAKYLYAEDFGLWCSLSRLGRVSCPAQVVYRYRQHGVSISRRKTVEQYECLSKIRHEYQLQYLRSNAISRETAGEVARFWTGDGSRPLAEGVHRVNSILTELRANFLAYIEDRYGSSERATLEADLDKTLSERLGYWLFRSIKFRDWKALGDLLSIAGARGESVKVSGKALAQVAGACCRTVLRRGGLC